VGGASSGRLLLAQAYMTGELDANLSGNEFDYTNSLTILVKNMLRNKLHRQKGFD